ncbi:similarity to UDP-Gal beta GlcNAC beta 1,4 galactosyltransferase [Encephalitozoon cuniculi GB-M1]|uniref:Similarity to UDP-Gal beta GlcNAC beta 1,4 galactosyltransferase n=2 Tax=Encephalitozoon cuniculi TaxID=6035 RepID=Q8SVS8_ENCCU|nr:uncharacterized protein ECU04_1120 [Encephalitozoon cuniculi GB-M1]AGE95319.1 UDP-gal beta glcnac beta 1,4 galactosyltransferase [Encephalitozoon cuniculi]KMV66315.1 hypothetical protein M970_041070 [Encephalitozoon cuniculi EcunIII-L]UYI27494.1 hypothetical protein J0A71_06g13650 [Encephalitozoon cuniculi]CAD25300.1 similarity to UDP-Gal beta GlcNAC beta 1,4 galactosyltransferase [Encephalitozoon cuniculi GB-M1]
MIYTAEGYEKVRKLLGHLCMVQSRANAVAYKVSKYKSESPVYLVEGNGGEVYLMGNNVFELECSGFDVGVPKEKEALVMLFRFNVENPMESTGKRIGASREALFVEVDAGPVTCNGKRAGTLITSSIPQSLDALSSVLRRFIRISNDRYPGGLERALVGVLSSNKIL